MAYTVIHPDGFPVTVQTEDRRDEFIRRGYTEPADKPKADAKPAARRSPRKTAAK